MSLSEIQGHLQVGKCLRRWGIKRLEPFHQETICSSISALLSAPAPHPTGGAVPREHQDSYASRAPGRLSHQQENKCSPPASGARRALRSDTSKAGKHTHQWPRTDRNRRASKERKAISSSGGEGTREQQMSTASKPQKLRALFHPTAVFIEMQHEAVGGPWAF